MTALLLNAGLTLVVLIAAQLIDSYVHRRK